MLLLLRQSPKKVCAAVNTIAVKDERSRNVVIYGISESDGGRLENKVAEVLGEINEKPSLRDCCRVDLKRADTSRLGADRISGPVRSGIRLIFTRSGPVRFYL